MTELLLALAALAVGPLLHRAAQRAPTVLQALDGFVLVSVSLLLLLFVLPHTWEAIGAWVLPLGFAGFLLPQWMDRFSQRWHHAADRAALVLGMVALVVHAATDGVALASADAAEPAMTAAIVLHRLPVGLAVWMLARPGLGRAGAVVVLAIVMLATCAGFWLGGIHAAAFDAKATALLLAFVSGSLLHVLFHQHTPVRLRAEPRANAAEAVGGALGLGLVLGMAVIGADYGHALPHGLHAAGHRFLHLALESAPALLLGYLAAGILGQVVPPASLHWLARGGTTSQVARGMVFGLPLPLCSCGVVPLYQALVRSGVPATAGMAFLVATPELGIEAFLLSFPLLGADLTLMRLAASAAVAMFVGLTIGYYTQRHAPAPAGAGSSRLAQREGGLVARLRAGIRYGLVDVADDTAVWILVGLGIAALIPPGALATWFSDLPPGSDVLLAMVVGIPTYVCASGATPIAAALIAAGVSPGAGLTFLLAGPATNVTTFGVLSALHGRRVALMFGVTVAGAALAMGVLTNLILPRATVVATGSSMEHGAFAWAALAVLSLVFVATLVRQGPRGFLQTLLKLRSQVQPRLEVEAGDCCASGQVQAAASCCTPPVAAPVTQPCCAPQHQAPRGEPAGVSSCCAGAPLRTDP